MRYCTKCGVYLSVSPEDICFACDTQGTRIYQQKIWARAERERIAFYLAHPTDTNKEAE